MAKLASKEYTSKHGLDRPIERTAVIAHGLLGQGKNWRSFARKLADDATLQSTCANTRWRIMTVDLRCHGESVAHGAPPPHDMPACATDIVRWVHTTLGGVPPDVICGHSLGGKVILEYCRQTALPESTLRRPLHAWVLDSQPGLVARNMVADVERVLLAVEDMPGPIASRRELQRRMSAEGFSEPLVQWMGSNLVDIPGDADGRLEWGFDITGAMAMYESYRETDYLPLLASPPAGITLNVLRAGASDRWNARMIGELDAAVSAAAVTAKGGGGSTVHHVLDNAGHWVHMDQPEKLRQMILATLQDVVAQSK